MKEPIKISFYFYTSLCTYRNCHGCCCSVRKKVSFGVKILNFGMSEHGLSVHAFFPARKQIAAFLLCKLFL